MDGTIESNGKLIMIAIDFGTTFSAASYVVLDAEERSEIKLGESMKDKIHDVWFPETPDGTQVRTQLAWNPYAQDFLWGNEVDDTLDEGEIDQSDIIELLKLGLDDRGKKTEPFKLALHRQLQSLKSQRGNVDDDGRIVDLVSIYLRKLKAHILDKIGTRQGNEFVARARIEYIMTVPALWNLGQLDTMVKAAEDAGISSPTLVSEPEAAAISCLHEDSMGLTTLRNGLNQENQPEGFLTLDAGGGTVDIITYFMESNKLREGARGIGGIHGSATLNWDFREFIERYLRDSFLGIFIDLGMPNSHRSRQQVINLAVAKFEEKKKSFNGGDMSMMLSNIGKKGRRIVIPSADIKPVFDRKLDRIIQMTREQINAFNQNNAVLGIKILYILFVGGLSRSKYAQNRLRAEFVSEGIEIRIQEQSSVLVSRGAIVRVLHQASIGEFYLRYGYGVIWSEKYNPRKHTEPWNRKIHGDHKVWYDFVDGARIVNDRAEFFCFAGTRVEAGQQKRIRGWLAADTGGGDIKVVQRMCRSKHVMKNGLTILDPKNGIEEINPLVFTIPGDQIKGYYIHNKLTGMDYEGFQWDIIMTLNNPRGTFEMIIPQDGKFQVDGSWGEKFKSYKADIHLASNIFPTRASTKNVVVEELGRTRRKRRRDD